MTAPDNAIDDRDRLGVEPARPVLTGLHPRVYAAVFGFVAWFALAIWGFAGAGITDYLLVIVSGFLFIVVALTLILWHVGHEFRRDGGAANADDPQIPFHDWAAADFQSWQDRLSGTQAATLILLPIASAAIGMTAFAIVFHFAERGGV